MGKRRRERDKNSKEGEKEVGREYRRKSGVKNIGEGKR